MWAPAAGFVVLATFLFSGYTSYQAAYVTGGEQRELFVQAGQASPDVPEWTERVRLLNRLTTSTWGEDLSVAIDDDVFWPYGFYLRNDDYARFVTYNADSTEPPDAHVIIMSGFDLAQLEQQLEGRGYTRIEYTHRWWWVPDYTSGGVSGWINWIIKREIWEEGEPPPGVIGDGALTGAVLVRSDLLELEETFLTS